ncbi:MAG: DUF6111 family protein [Tagaea sp.]|nr:hypothetical protein [Azospirillum sp.]MCA3264751.1 hypothetical protein [Azospirillum sp.]MCZ8122091.1 DUF6111 family protein [Magnetospirillum sp.]
MSRIFLQIVLPLLLPFIAYGVWLSVERRRAEKLGRGEVPGWSEAPVVWLGLAGLVLATIATVGLLLLPGGNKVSGDYVPPHLENGRIVPGHIEPARR